MSTGDYPLGAANDPRAPYNEVENPEVEIDVVVTTVWHKTFKIKVRDYTITDKYKDEDGQTCIERDFSTCNLYEAVANQIDLPHPVNGWTEDEFEVVIDDFN